MTIELQGTPRGTWPPATGGVAILGRLASGAKVWLTNPILSALTLSGLTPGRVPIVSTNGLLADDAGMTYDAANDRLTLAGGLALGSGSLKFSIGTAFPGSPATGDVFYRSDLGWLCFYDGTRWLTIHDQAEHLSVQSQPNNFTSVPVAVPRTDYAPYVTRVKFISRVNTTNDGSKFWTVALRGINLAYSAATTIYQFTTASDTVNVFTKHEAAASTPNPSNSEWFDLSGSKTSTPGTLDCAVELYYRLIVT